MKQLMMIILVVLSTIVYGYRDTLRYKVEGYNEYRLELALVKIGHETGIYFKKSRGVVDLVFHTYSKDYLHGSVIGDQCGGVINLCMGTLGRESSFLNLVRHELGHYFGLGHVRGFDVMNAIVPEEVCYYSLEELEHIWSWGVRIPEGYDFAAAELLEEGESVSRGNSIFGGVTMPEAVEGGIKVYMPEEF